MFQVGEVYHLFILRDKKNPLSEEKVSQQQQESIRLAIDHISVLKMKCQTYCEEIANV